MRLFRNTEENPEGKYPIVLRRDGTPLKARYFVMALKDPCVEDALRAYASRAKEEGMAEEYVADIEALADEALQENFLYGNTTDPDAPKHREDDPAILAWARENGCPGS
ncbi:MAG: hypothetical protein GY906_12940 [bacterium]|nr:hypothetical protein [bacterium]